MATGLSRKDLDQCVLLRFAGFGVQIQGRSPFRQVHRAGRVHCHGDVETGEVHRTKIPFVDVPAYHRGAVSFGGRTKKDARTRSLAIAGLKVLSVEFPLLSHYSCSWVRLRLGSRTSIHVASHPFGSSEAA